MLIKKQSFQDYKLSIPGHPNSPFQDSHESGWRQEGHPVVKISYENHQRPFSRPQ